MPENRVKEFREKAGLTQCELARRVKMASTNLSDIERGQRVAWAKAREAIAKALKTDEAELFPECKCKQGDRIIDNTKTVIDEWERQLVRKEKMVLSVAEVGAYLGLSRNATYAACLSGAIPHLKIGKRILITKAAIEKMLAECQVKTVSK